LFVGEGEDSCLTLAVFLYFLFLRFLFAPMPGRERRPLEASIAMTDTV